MRSSLILLALSPFVACKTPESEPFARAAVIDRADGGVGGPKALAREGDILLENDHFRIGINASETSMGPGLFGGGIVDADLQWNDPRFPPGYGNDQLAEVFTTVNMNVIKPGPGGVHVLADGSDGGAAIVRVEGPAEPFLTLLGALWGLVGAPDWGIVTDYVAEPGVPWLTIRTTATAHYELGGTVPLATTGEPVDYPTDNMPLIEWGVETGLIFGEFYLQGGAVDVFAPGMGFDEDGEVYEASLRGENTMTSPFKFDFVAGVGDGVSYGIAPKEGVSYVPLFTSSQTAMFGGGKEGNGNNRFPPGTAYTYERFFFVGHGDVGSIVDQFVEARAIPYGTVSGTVVEAGTGAPLSGVDVFAYPVTGDVVDDRPWNQWRTDVDPRDDVDDGGFSGRLPVGTWELRVHAHGRPAGEALRIDVVEGEALSVQLASPRPGALTFTVRDEIGRPVPAKVTIFRVDDDPQADPILGDSYVAGDPEFVLFPLYGDGEVDLPAGTYYAVASRGIEYEIDVSDEFVVDESRAAHLDLEVIRSVETEGWVSADLHVHAYPSHDSGVRLDDRVRTMACEGVEFFSSNDHDYLTDYAPVIEDLGVEEWVQSAVGNEITTVEIGHFLGFPLQIEHLEEAGGAVDWTGKFPGDLLGALRSQGEQAGFRPTTFIGHPRDGILGYFDQYGFDPYGGQPGFQGAPGVPAMDPALLSATNPLLRVENISWEFDSLELLNGKRMELIRTPTQEELDRYGATEDVPVYEMIERTLAEQQALIDGTYRLGYGHEGQVDDWFTLLNLGFKYTAIGNSDTHGWTSVESGCPRNFIVSETDDPAFVDDQEMADAVKAHRVLTTYGPFVRFEADGQPIGSEITPDGPVELRIEVQAPMWIDVDRVELYENGTLIREWAGDDIGRDDVLRFDETFEVVPARDSWYVVMVLGDQDLSPVFTSVEMPQIELQMVVSEALSGVEQVGALLSPAVPIPRTYPILPYALTNPIWVDLAGDGFDAPGLPAWLERPVEPE